MALKHHPDRNPGDPSATERVCDFSECIVLCLIENQFQEINHAFDVLNDPQKRELYDQYGEEGLKEGGGPGMNADDIFSHFFGGGFGGSTFCLGSLV